MPALITIRLHPTEPVAAADFTSALTGLKITAYDLTFKDSKTGTQLGTATGLADPHVADLGNNTVDITKTQILQHYADVPIDPNQPLLGNTRVLESAATAVVVAPDNYQPEYNSFDLRLDLNRNGTAITDKTIDFNITVATPSTLSTNQVDYFIMAASAYAALPSTSSTSQIVLPADGTPPSFATLKDAINGVLAKDPADGQNLAARPLLTAAQSQQIAAELVWDRKVYPPPSEPRPLGEMYTKPANGSAIDEHNDNDRKKFEAEQQGYYATHNAEAARLAGFVYATSAAVQCERLSAGGTVPNADPSGTGLVGAQRVGFPFPVITGSSAPLDTEVILTPTSGPTVKDQFVVPAAYFYALAATLPPQVGVAQRYDMARFDTESKVLQEIQTAIDAGVVSSPESAVTVSGASAKPVQAARRLRALGVVPGSLPEIPFDPQIAVLVTDWLGHDGPTASIDQDFWLSQELKAGAHAAEYLDLVLQIVTEDWTALITAIKAAPLNVTNVPGLVAVTDQQWRELFLGPPPPPVTQPRVDLLPPFTQPGTPAERVEVFIRHLRKFFIVPPGNPDGTPTTPGGPPRLGLSTSDAFARFSQAYSAHGGGAFTFGTARDPSISSAAVADTFPGDADAQAWLTETLDIIDALCNLTSFAAPPDSRAQLRFSLMEALYARGFTSTVSVRALSPAAFQSELTGTVAYPFAADIQTAAGGSTASSPATPGAFQPVNPDGSLTDCVPPPHLSPFGPVAYLHELLLASAASTVTQPIVPGDPNPVHTLVASRRGALGELLATHANLDTPLPVIDLVNESLETLAAAVAPGGSGAAGGTIYDTAPKKLAGHPLRGNGTESGHDPATLFAAIPEHSSPAAVAVPTAESAAYAALRTDFSAPELPYDQPLDVCRSYLRQLRTSRFSAMRHFRKQITEFVLDPANEPTDFASHLWRYPVRFDIAREYLGISTDEYDLLYRQDIADVAGAGALALYQVYGFTASTVHDTSWTTVVLGVSEFLPRTGLTYCEFLDLQQCGFVGFVRAGSGNDGETTVANGGFPACEPCCLDELRIAFTDPNDAQDPATVLRKLAVFVRLWRRLSERPGQQITFALLTTVSTVLNLFNGNTINPDFLRQLAALLMLCDDLRLPLAASQSVPSPLLSLWTDPKPSTWDDSVALLLDAIEDYAEARHHCRRRGPEFLKVIADNLDRLSILAGFDPNVPTDTWYARPTHTLRFVEILGKIYASEFTVGEILFLFTTGDHLDGDDPFPLQDHNESLDDPLALPEAEATEGDGEHSLWALRRALLAVRVEVAESREWSWARIAASLRDEFGYVASGSGPDLLLQLGEHFFPGELQRCGHSVDPLSRQYRTSLSAANTSPHMWIAPPDGPFGYDENTEQLWTRLPVRDSAVIEKLSELRPLRLAEQVAVRDLYFAPRAALAPFAPLFENFDHAVDRLVQDPNETERFAFFQGEFARFHRRCTVIAEHLAAHVAAATGKETHEGDRSDGHATAWRVLRSLLADENLARAPWEDDSGQLPPTTWGPRPSGGAFAALLGLAGTGLLGEFRASQGPTKDTAVWRETRGPLSAFGIVRDEHNAPVPTVLPALELRLTPEQLRLVSVRNGFALRDSNGEPLGGAQPFTVRWTGVLLIEGRGKYRFHAGAPTDSEREPDFAAAQHNRWRVTVGRGQKTWTLLNHGWPGEDAPANCSAPLALRRGAYRITVEFQQTEPTFDRPEEICPVHTGFQVKYAGPDSHGSLVAIPFDRLFRDTKDSTLGAGIERLAPSAITNATAAPHLIGADEQAADYLDQHYPSTLRDIRRTYQRAFKALLFAERFRLSARPASGYRQSELGFLLEYPAAFEGTSYYRTGQTSFAGHHAWLDFDLLPVADPYPPVHLRPPYPAVDDQRSNPSTQRQAALFDWWERIFDYCRLRAETEGARERPAWLLFAEVIEQQPDNPAELLRHLGVDLRHAALVSNYFDARLAPPIYSVGGVGSVDLADERWAVRVWHAETWLRGLRAHFVPAQIETARPALWAGDDPSVPVDAPPWISPPQSGNANLTGFVQDGYLERGEPRRYENLRRLNDALRERARTALLAYLCGMDRVPLPWAVGQYARAPQDLSDLLLQDVEAGIAQRASRIEDAISAVQTFVQRARLGLEPAFLVTPAFAQLWERRFGTFRIWEAARRREIYRENWIEWDELRAARESEAFRLLEDQLRRTVLTVAVPGGMDWWPESSGHRPAEHSALVTMQANEPAEIQLRRPLPEGLGLLGAPEHAARPSWLAPVRGLPSAPSGGNGGSGGGDGPVGGVPVDTPRDVAGVVVAAPTAVAVTGNATTGTSVGTSPDAAEHLPLWLRAAVKLGTSFVRVAAAGLPPASAEFVPRHTAQVKACCAACEHDQPPVVDEYYFWLADSRFFTDTDATQNADAGVATPDPTRPDTSDWHRPDKLPGLLHWESKPMVHLYWSRVHHGEFEPPRRSDEGLAITPDAVAQGGVPQLRFDGRVGDSLRFEAVDDATQSVPVNVGVTPPGYTDPEPPGFRYDLATDSAVLLPLVTQPSAPATTDYYGLAAYPFFGYFLPGAPLLPPSPFAVALTVAGTLRTHCGFEAALKWYELAYPPLARDNTWAVCTTGNATDSRGDVPCCPSAPVDDDRARDRAILLAYLETLLQWGESLLCRNSPEASRQAAVLFDTMRRLLGSRPTVVPAQDDTGEPQSVATFAARPAPLNPRLVSLYDRSADRLTLVRHALDGHRLRGRKPVDDKAFWDEDTLRDGWRETTGRCEADCSADEECLCCAGPYRFSYLVQKAIELVGEVRGLGAELLAAYEKGDAEALAALRATHERQLLELALRTRQFQWREADWQVQAMGKSKEGALTRLRYYQQLLLRGRNAGETGYESLTEVAIASRVAGNVSEAIAQGVGLIPDFWTGVAGLGPLAAAQMPLGIKLASATFATAARIMNAIAENATTNAGLNLTEGGWQRRTEEWQHQVEIIGIEIEQIERQILAAERHRDAALRDLNSHQRQIEHSVEVQDFLRDKFTNAELYLYLQQETAALHRELYELAHRTARRAQRAFNNERGHLARVFLPENGWDNLHDGLVAGERLQVALRQMEIAYLDANCREYELTKHLSLRLDFPLAFLHLQATGWAEIEIPEWLFDLDYPGHYLRRIKNVTLSIPCVVGPYTGVHCRLTLLSSTTRVDPRLTKPTAACCHEAPEECRCANGYQPLPEDPRLVRGYAATEAIATSSGQNDSGLFELNFRDERYLPFEFAGAVSRWRIELPPENNRFDFDTLGDVVLHLNYTAREGGDLLRRAANELAQRHLPGAGLRLFDIRHDFPDDWYRLTSGDPGSRHLLPLRLGREHFPFLPGDRNLRISRLELFVELADPDGRADLPVRFVTEHEADHRAVDHRAGEDCRCAGHDIDCVASAEWPALYHGVLDAPLRPLRQRGDRELGLFHFPATYGPIDRIFLVCTYSEANGE